MRLATVLAVVVVACGGSIAPVSNDDAGSSPAAYDGDPCAAYADLGRRCTGSAACADARASSCRTFIGMMSDVYRQMLLRCASVESCNDIDAPTAACISSVLDPSAFTDAQRAVAGAYCAQCGDVTGCTSDFFAYPPANDKGMGLLVAYSGDALASKIRAACVGECGMAFGACALNVVAAAFPPTPDACR